MENLKPRMPKTMAEVEAMADELRERNEEWRSFEAADMLNRFDTDLKSAVMLAGLAIAILLYEGKTKGNLNNIDEAARKMAAKKREDGDKLKEAVLKDDPRPGDKIEPRLEPEVLAKLGFRPDGTFDDPDGPPKDNPPGAAL